ncbi:nucleotidyltransferase family protein [Mucilaginibacter robiniae]|uniref:Nucleotidyltransferase family protein n=1 Tax=Mucilaginibacter robiniae TaxID=2728022 RepID=A0A7L5DZM7_9SPHI|nr:nucleotidyltransferase [Mucilaginibacter robiniae]QJD95557.1 nucleotidyltransferase family protein [Mucilaginibacter robiniae]
MVINEDEEAIAFYKEALDHLNDSGIDYMLGGAFAIFHYTGLYRDTKDLDVYCRSTDCPRILKYFAEQGYTTEFTDARWLAKIFKGEYFIDLIFDTVNNICRVDDSWFERAVDANFFDHDLKLLSAEEVVWSKIYVQNRERFDGADLNHLLLQYGANLDWKHLLFRIDPHWQLLLAQLLSFQFVYPADYQNIVPRWLYDELLRRAGEQYDLPSPTEKVCRGPMIDQTQYCIDIKEWDYKSYTIKTV